MARRTFTRTIVQRQSTPTIRISAPAPVTRRGRGRRAARRVGRAIVNEKDMLIPIVASLALGYAEKEKIAIPQVLGLSVPASSGLIAFGIGKLTKSRLAMMSAVGLLCVAANRWASGTSGVSGVGVVFDDDDF